MIPIHSGSYYLNELNRSLPLSSPNWYRSIAQYRLPQVGHTKASPLIFFEWLNYWKLSLAECRYVIKTSGPSTDLHRCYVNIDKTAVKTFLPRYLLCKRRQKNLGYSYRFGIYAKFDRFSWFKMIAVFRVNVTHYPEWCE